MANLREVFGFRSKQQPTFLETAQHFFRKSPPGSVLDANSIPAKTSYRSEPTDDEIRLEEARKVLKQMLEHDKRPRQS